MKYAHSPEYFCVLGVQGNIIQLIIVITFTVTTEKYASNSKVYFVV